VAELDEDFVRATNARWRGLGLGYDNGLWGQVFAQGIKADVPFGPKVGQFFGLRLRGVMMHSGVGEGYDPVFMGGAELFGRGPVLAGIVRVYGGGGLWYGAQVVGDDGATGLAGGGHYGIEALVWDRGSFSFEVGGQSGLHGDGPGIGASVMAGTTVYLGALGK
jgi:hypothetical protein